MELYHLNQTRPDERPATGMGKTIIVEAAASNIEEVLSKVKSIWVIVAGLGRIWDKNSETDSRPDYSGGIPQWIIDFLPEIVDWEDDLEEREWIWWSSAIIGNRLKIDLEAEAFPIGIRILLRLIERSGGKVIYDDIWVDSSIINRL